MAPTQRLLTPRLVTSQADGRIVSAMFEGLTRFNAVPPRLSRPWPSAGKSRRRDGLYFSPSGESPLSTGEPITAADIVYSWQRAVNPLTASDYAGMFFYVKNAGGD